MTRILLGIAICTFAVAGNVRAQADGQAQGNGGTAESAVKIAEAKALAAKIDALLLKSMRQAKIEPATAADAPVLIRRLHLDLAGRIPSLTKVSDFLDDDRADRFSVWTEELLQSEEYVKHFANVWRSILLPDKEDNFLQQLAFEDWMEEQLQSNRSYDKIAKNLLTGLREKNKKGSPSAFYLANGNKAEDMAAATARVLLGVRLECAQCHAHPFAEWTQEEFWRLAAFFNRRQVRYDSEGRFLRPKIAVADKKQTVQATFLDGTEPGSSSEFNGPTVLAEWIGTKDNPYFARAAVDHLWQYFFNASLLEPILQGDEGVKHPELLDLLAREFAAHDFDLKFMIRALVHTKAYQRSSQAANQSGDALAYFARMPVRGLSPQQLYDSLLIATQIKQPTMSPAAMLSMASNPFNSPRAEFLRKFAGSGSNTESSILQALFLMNGEFLSDRISARKQDILPVLVKMPISHEKRLRTMFLVVLSRPPSAEEMRRLSTYISHGSTESQVEALSDIYWALLNSAEFRLNH